MADIPVWNGDYEKLPPEGTIFLFEDKRYRWDPCPCGCERPIVTDISTEVTDEAMTILVRGTDPGDPRLKLLLEIGATPKEIANAMKAGSPTSGEMLRDLMAKDPVGKGLVTEERLEKLLFMASMPEALVTLLESLGDEFTDDSNPGGIFN